MLEPQDADQATNGGLFVGTALIDTLYGDGASEQGSDGSGPDGRLLGGNGGDFLFGDHGDLSASTGGNDIMDGQRGNNRLWGGGGRDIMSGGSGRDHLYGGAGNDIFYGSSESDTLVGGAGADILIGICQSSRQECPGWRAGAGVDKLLTVDGPAGSLGWSAWTADRPR